MESAKLETLTKLQEHQKAVPLQAGTKAAVGAGLSPFGEDGLTFGDLIDAVNPLQQLPVVSSLYRSATGTGISAFSRVVGGFLLGGPLGAAAAAVNAVVQGATGQDVGENIISAMNGDATSQTTEMKTAAMPVQSSFSLQGPASSSGPTMGGVDVPLGSVNPLHALVEKDRQQGGSGMAQQANAAISNISSKLLSV